MRRAAAADRYICVYGDDGRGRGWPIMQDGRDGGASCCWGVAASCVPCALGVVADAAS